MLRQAQKQPTVLRQEKVLAFFFGFCKTLWRLLTLYLHVLCAPYTRDGTGAGKLGLGSSESRHAMCEVRDMGVTMTPDEI